MKGMYDLLLRKHHTSSYHEYLTGGKVAKTELLLSMLGGTKGFLDFMNTEDNAEYLEDRSILSEKEAVRIFYELYPEGPSFVQTINREQRDNVVVSLSEAGLIAAQICRITGIGKAIVYRVLK